MGVDPPRHEAAPSPQRRGDVERLVAIEGEADAPQPIALDRLAFGFDHPTQLPAVARPPLLHLHAASLLDENA
jgi:hypothetical protein